MKESVNIFKKILIDILCEIINCKLSFSDDLLNLAWRLESQDNTNPFSSKLWKTIFNTSKNLIEKPNKKDWFWFERFVLSSNVSIAVHKYVMFQQNKKFSICVCLGLFCFFLFFCVWILRVVTVYL